MFYKMHLTIASAAIAAAIFCVPTASAGPINPGFDLFHTESATLDLSGIGIGLGLGLTDFEGVTGGPGNTDTIVERKTSLPDNVAGTIDVEIVALQLRSIDPVNIGGTDYDIDVTLDLTATNPADGEYDVPTPHITVVNIDSFFDVFVELDFFEVGNPGNTFTEFGMDRFASENDPWSHLPPPLYPVEAALPPGGFYPGSPTYTSDMQNGGTGLFNSLSLTPAIPEPGTLALFCIGLAGLGFARRRKAAA